MKRAALRCFGLLAEAEAQVHDCAVEAVHFHEVGALDAPAARRDSTAPSAGTLVGVCSAANRDSVRSG